MNNLTYQLVAQAFAQETVEQREHIVSLEADVVSYRELVGVSLEVNATLTAEVERQRRSNAALREQVRALLGADRAREAA